MGERKYVRENLMFKSFRDGNVILMRCNDKNENSLHIFPLKNKCDDVGGVASGWLVEKAFCKVTTFSCDNRLLNGFCTCITDM